MKLFEFAVIYQGKKDKDGEWTKKPQIITLPEVVLVKDASEAQIRAAQSIGKEWTDELDRVEVAVRPF